MKVMGPDGIERDLNEHYDTMMDVEQDPFGAHEAIQNLWDERERLRAAMVHVKAASDLLDKNGMKPGWGVAKDLLHAALKGGS